MGRLGVEILEAAVSSELGCSFVAGAGVEAVGEDIDEVMGDLEGSGCTPCSTECIFLCPVINTSAFQQEKGTTASDNVSWSC